MKRILRIRCEDKSGGIIVLLRPESDIPSLIPVLLNNKYIRIEILLDSIEQTNNPIENNVIYT